MGRPVSWGCVSLSFLSSASTWKMGSRWSSSLYSLQSLTSYLLTLFYRNVFWREGEEEGILPLVCQHSGPWVLGLDRNRHSVENLGGKQSVLKSYTWVFMSLRVSSRDPIRLN